MDSRAAGRREPVEPLMAATWSFGARACATAWPALAAGGSALDAVEQACRHAEADESVDSVGYGGLPDRDGIVTLDGCVMLDPDRCGSVCALRRSRHPVTVARRVMERTEHVMLAGEGADAFAAAAGVPQEDALAPSARDAWNAWRAAPAPVDQSRDRGLRPVDRGPGGDGRLFAGESEDERRWRGHDTIGVLARDVSGMIAGGCSTSGTPYKLPGRVGDSPIIGHGLYVDQAVGGATATGTGELIMGVCGAFLAVELMRLGRSPAQALEAVLRRIVERFKLQPHHQVAIVAMRVDGTTATAAIRPGYRTALFSRSGGTVVEPGIVLIP